ncbi:hypothetical protein GF373_09350 [bacterium]|nr:hypothetical protein [bacterium]
MPIKLTGLIAVFIQANPMDGAVGSSYNYAVPLYRQWIHTYHASEVETVRSQHFGYFGICESF